MPGIELQDAGLTAVANFGSLLKVLVDEAASTKQTATVEPTLTKSDFRDLNQRVSSALSPLGGSVRDLGILKDAATKEDAANVASDAAKESGQEQDVTKAEALKAEAKVLKSDAENAKLRQFAVVETATRDLFDNLIATTSIDSPEFVKMWNLLDIVSILSDDEQCEPALLFWLVEELLDSQTVNGCRVIFDYLESRRERITARKFEQKSLVILRSCNELLRRLSRAEDTAFCGRVFIFMFQSFPLGDRSSVNLRGEYHVENVTTYEKLSPAEDSKMDVDSQTETQKETQETRGTVAKGVSFDPANAEQHLPPDMLYPLFWSLQENFSQPLKLFQDSNFAKFKTSLEATIRAFEAIDYEDDSRVSKSVDDSNRNLKRKRGSESPDGSETFAPKYLTSKDLFELEISDLSFRRHVLVQTLIILDFLLGLTPKGREKWAAIPKFNKSMVYADELKEEDAKWAVEMKERIASYLRRGGDGPFFYRTVETVLARDKNWVIWKMAGCPRIQRDPVAPKIFTEAKTAAQRMASHKRLRPIPMGAVSLDFLRDEDEETAMEKLKSEDRYQLPELDDFKRKIADDDFEIEMPTNEQTKAAAIAGKSSKSWRALRIAGRFKLASFDKIDDPQNVSVVFEKLEDLDNADEESEPAAGDDDMPTNREPLVVSGPVGVGKTEVLGKLLQQHKGVFSLAVRHTTRGPGEGETDRKTFYFVSSGDFAQLRDDDRLIEHGTRNGVDYGTASKEIEGITEIGKVPVIELDIDAAQFAKDMGFAARYVLIKPSTPEVLQARLEKSGKDTSTVQEVLGKLPDDLSESKTAGLFDIVIDGDDIDAAGKALDDYIFQKDGDTEMQPGAEELTNGKEHEGEGAEAGMTDATAPEAKNG